MNYQCYFCTVKSAEKLIDKFRPEEKIAENFVFEVNRLLAESRENPTPLLSTFINRYAKKQFNSDDLYAEEKEHANSLLMEQYNNWKQYTLSSEHPLHTAAKLAVAGNIIDYGAHTAPADIQQQIKELLKKDLAIDDTPELFDRIKKAKSVLYLGDNAGEIVFDKLFIELLEHPNLTFAVRGEKVLNDITIEDAAFTGIDQICKVIHNGFDAPSTLLSYCSSEFQKAFNSADLIISKGQGNFEGLLNESNDKIFFMLMAKCKPMGEILGVKEGSLVVTSKKNLKQSVG